MANPLKANTILSLFSLSQQSHIDTCITLQILHLSHCGQRDNKDMYTATLRDLNTKYNGFLFMVEIDTTLKEFSFVNIKSLRSLMAKKKCHMFIINEFEVLEMELSALLALGIQNEVKLIKDEDGVLTYDTGEFIYDTNTQITTTTALTTEVTAPPPQTTETTSLTTTYTSLRQLTTFSQDFIILVRVIKKSEIKIFAHSASEQLYSKLFYFVGLDKDGDEIQISCFNKVAERLYLSIIENEVYEIKGGYVKRNDKKFIPARSEYKIVLNENSVVKHVPDVGVIKNGHINIIPINELGSLTLYSMVDVCGIVLDVGDKTKKNTKNGSQYMKKVIIGDTSQSKIELSLWRHHASVELKKGDIILLKQVKIGDFNGRNLSTFDETSVLINPTNIPEVSTLMNYIKANSEHAYDEAFYFDLETTVRDNNNHHHLMFGDNTYTYANTTMNDYNNVYYINDVLENGNDGDNGGRVYWVIKATITNFIHNAKNYYLGCGNQSCRRKLKFDNKQRKYYCGYCNGNAYSEEYYYTLCVRVKDCSKDYWIDIFGKPAELLMQMKAEEYKDIVVNKNMEQLKKINELFEFKEFFFYVRTKTQVYRNGMLKKKIYAYRVEYVKYKENAKRLVKALKRKLLSNNNNN